MKTFAIIFSCLFTFCAFAQSKEPNSEELRGTNFSSVDSLERLLKTYKEDTTKVRLLSRVSFAYTFSEPEKGVYYAQKGIGLAEKLDFQKGKVSCQLSLCFNYWALGNYNSALQLALYILRQAENSNDLYNISQCYLLMTIVYRDVGDYERALAEAYKAAGMNKSLGVSPRVSYANIGSIYELQNRLDSASKYVEKAHDLDLKDNNGQWDWIYYLFGNIEAKKKNYNAALSNYRTAIRIAHRTNIYKTIVESLNGIAIVHREIGNKDSCIYYANQVIQKWSKVSYQKGVLNTSDILASVYKVNNQKDSVIKYLEYSAALKNKLFSQEQERDIQNMAFGEQMRQNILERERLQYENRLKFYALISIAVIFLIIAFMLWRNNQQRKKSFNILRNQQEETEIQKLKAENALLELRATQAQLIQSEKMASLGELTAGIAHEIQNPLNFVNNYSEVNVELIEEIKEELEKGNLPEIKAIVADLEENEAKIHHHGQRADSIVRSMMQHSRTNSGTKEPTNLNALADEYLRLAYHGLRAKDSSFQADFSTDFDETLPMVEVVQQDMGRVLLNIINNAFQAVNEKGKSGVQDYQPSVKVTTKRLPLLTGEGWGEVERGGRRYGEVKSGEVQITISDNGPGIPEAIKDKIFQPFFTTKPTGQGTGLGLSLAYDIVKTHGGELRVESNEGEGTTFFLILPL